MVQHRLRLFVVNSFVTDNGLTSGNPAGVVLLPPNQITPTDEQMQAVASQMNLSETAFLRWTEESPLKDVHIRWFTPRTEVDLCGHATLAAAAALGLVIPLPRVTELQTKNSGILCVQSLEDGRISMDFPVDQPSEMIEHPEVLLALGVEKGHVRRGRYDIVVELDKQEQVEQLKPNLAALAKIKTRGVAVCARGADDDVAFVARFFAPLVGIDEDPVTGSMMCLLAPLFLENDAPARKARQLSARSGVLHVALKDDRVEISGAVAIVVDGHLLL